MKYKTTYFFISLNEEISQSKDVYRSRLDIENIDNILNYSNQSFRQKVISEINNKRFTDTHEKELTDHLNNISKEGWKLHSMNPVIKGYRDYYSSNYGGYGYGHDVLEGFVLVWEKE